MFARPRHLPLWHFPTCPSATPFLTPLLLYFFCSRFPPPSHSFFHPLSIQSNATSISSESGASLLVYERAYSAKVEVTVGCVFFVCEHVYSAKVEVTV